MDFRDLVKDVPMPSNEDTLIVQSYQTYQSPMRPMTIPNMVKDKPCSEIEPGFYVFIRPNGRCTTCGLGLGHHSIPFSEKVNELFDSTPKEQWPSLSLDGIFNELGISRLRYCCRNTLAFPKVYTYNQHDMNKLKNTSILTVGMRNCPINILTGGSKSPIESESIDEINDGEQEFTSVEHRNGHVIRKVPIEYPLTA